MVVVVVVVVVVIVCSLSFCSEVIMCSWLNQHPVTVLKTSCFIALC